MRSLRCRRCEIRWPAKPDFQRCPRCNVQTLRDLSQQPNASAREVASVEFEAFYGRWEESRVRANMPSPEALGIADATREALARGR